jgi:ankyrin repeat protein
MKQGLKHSFNPPTPPAEVDDFIRAAARGDNNAVKDYLNQFPEYIDSPGVHSYGKQPALIKAIMNGRADTVELLLKNGADANAYYEGETALYFAAEDGDIAIAKLLLQYGAAVNVNPKVALSPLTKAVDQGHFEFAKLLVTHGARPDLADNEGVTPLIALQVSIYFLEEDLAGSPSDRATKAELKKARELETLFQQAINAPPKPKPSIPPTP